MDYCYEVLVSLKDGKINFNCSVIKSEILRSLSSLAIILLNERIKIFDLFIDN